MHTTLQLLELAKQRLAARHGLPLPITDYRLAKLLGVSVQNVSAWQRGRTRIGTEFAARFAEACELPGEYVYACVERERAHDPAVQGILERIAERFANHAAVLAAVAILAAGMGIASPAKAAVSARFAVSPDIHYAKRRRRPAKSMPARDPLTDAWRKFQTLTPRAQPTFR